MTICLKNCIKHYKLAIIKYQKFEMKTNKEDETRENNWLEILVVENNWLVWYICKIIVYISRTLKELAWELVPPRTQF